MSLGPPGQGCVSAGAGGGGPWLKVSPTHKRRAVSPVPDCLHELCREPKALQLQRTCWWGVMRPKTLWRCRWGGVDPGFQGGASMSPQGPCSLAGCSETHQDDLDDPVRIRVPFAQPQGNPSPQTQDALSEGSRGQGKESDGTRFWEPFRGKQRPSTCQGSQQS